MSVQDTDDDDDDDDSAKNMSMLKINDDDDDIERVCLVRHDFAIGTPLPP